MIAEKSGGPAFPVILGHNAIQQPVYAQGMTLRDYFAGKALSGLMANVPKSMHGMNWVQNVVTASYEAADTMIAERAK